MLYDLVTHKVKADSARLTEMDDYLPAIDAALARYSKHRPKEVAADLDGNGTRDLSLPEGWLPDFSRILAIEYPIGDEPETLLASDAWKFYRAPAGLKLRLLEDTPAVGEFVRVTFTVIRAEADVPVSDEDAVACLAASICLRTLAALYGQTSDPTIQADVVNYRSKTDEFRRLADSLEERFNAHLGIDPKGSAPAASAIAAPSKSDRTRLTH